MNLVYRSIWNDKTRTFVAVSENAVGAGKRASSRVSAVGSTAGFVLKALAVSLTLSFVATSYALPSSGVVAAGTAAITSTTSTTTITQSTQNTVINWQSFGIATGQTVKFVQPNSSSVALNRVIGANPSAISGNLSANGQVFLVNPEGVLIGNGASVNVGGLVASTLNITDANFMAGRYIFSNPGSGKVVNQGTINADGGYVALLGTNVSNQGTISARLGTVVLAAGNGVTLDLVGDKLLNVTVDQGAVKALVENGGLVQADGGLVVMTAQGAGNLLATVVNNTGVIRAQTLSNVNGTIKLLADMGSGTVNVSGTLDASAPIKGDGGFIETSAAQVNVKDSSRITTASALGLTGHWLIDPQDFTVGSGPTGNISGSTLSGLLVTNSVTISTATGPDATVAGTPPVTSLNTAKPGNGDIFINDAVSWTASSSPTTLSLFAARDVNVNNAVTATKGNFAVCCGRDINVNAAITTTNGSVLLSAGGNVNQKAAITVTDGNLMMCAANNVNVSAAITLTNGSLIPSQSLGLPRGLTLRADNDGTGPSVAGGTLVFAAAAPKVVVTNAPVAVYYNPVSYLTPTDYSSNFTLTAGATLAQYMLVFPDGANKTFDGTTTATFSSLKGSPAGVTLVAGPGATATFATADPGIDKTVTFSGYTLGGPNAGNFAFATSCCAPIGQKTTATVAPLIVQAPLVLPPVVVVAPVVIAAPVVVVAPVVALAPTVTVANITPVVAVAPTVTAAIIAPVPPVVPPLLLPQISIPVVAAPLILASLESPPAMKFVVTPVEALPKVVAVFPTEVPAPPPSFSTPVRPRKQGRQ